MAAAGLILAACSESGLNEPSGEWSDAPLRITASVNEEITTRADEPFPSDVDFYFTYTPSGQSNYNSKQILFDAKGDDKKIYLNWENVKISSNLYFVLDNVPKDDNYTSNNIDLTKIIDKEDQLTNRDYNAQPESGTGKGNDILWQRIAVPTKPNTLEPIHFELQHLMSKVSFEISSSNDEIKNLLKPGKTTVKLWNVVKEPSTNNGSYTFDRIKGTVTISGDLNEQNNAVIIEGKEETSEENIVSVTTDSWIFPPQEFRDKDNRPKLQVCITDETDETKTFTGTLPESMIIIDEDGKKTSHLLEFLPGYHLVIRVELGNWTTDQTIYFKPVLVKKWKEYGPLDININQVGVYDAEGLKKLVDAWNAGPDNNLLTLKKYGVLEGDTWTFNLWKSITGYNSSTPEDNLGFKPRSDYRLEFKSNGHKVNNTTISDVTLEKSQTAK